MLPGMDLLGLGLEADMEGDEPAPQMPVPEATPEKPHDVCGDGAAAAQSPSPLRRGVGARRGGEARGGAGATRRFQWYATAATPRRRLVARDTRSRRA